MAAIETAEELASASRARELSRRTGRKEGRRRRPGGADGTDDLREPLTDAASEGGGPMRVRMRWTEAEDGEAPS